MKYTQIEYFEWVKNNYPKTKYNLAISGVFPPGNKTISEITPDISDWHSLPIGFDGDQQLLKLLSERYQIPQENILTASGASKANFLAMAAIIEPGDTVIVESPNYEPLVRIPQMLGAKVQFIERLPSNNYEVDLEAINELMTKNVSLITITNLHNPSGVVMSKKELKALCELVEDNNCHLLSDEVYREFVFDKPPPQAAELSERAITTNSLTKVYGLGNLRAGWIMANTKLINKCRKIKFHTSVITSPVTEKLAYHALLNIDKLIAHSRSVLKKNTPIIKKWIKKQDYFDVKIPKHAAYCFPKFFNINVTELSEMLSNYYETLIVPGKFFGTAEFARIGYGVPTEVLQTGLENIENAVNALIKPN
ncbi:MAG: aminotransferase class I/II-fold pyridoxal phosphate-dependent enzyme [Thermoplasmata archaeon]|nr:MAG: aminotransferase class I/II-fold pyridoxal phosphate-dependent enzyme [Thermoplasmata archaeon]